MENVVLDLQFAEVNLAKQNIRGLYLNNMTMHLL
jgi:hypothetical protein